MLSDDQANDLRKKMRAESKAGRPEVAALMRKAAEQQEVYEVPEVEEKPVIEQPPFNGPGSGKQAWVEYAEQVSEIDEEVLDALGRDDIVAMLKSNGLVLPSEEPKPEKPKSTRVKRKWVERQIPE